MTAVHSPAPWLRGQTICDTRAGGDHVAFVGINDRNGVRIGAIGMVDVSREQAEANLALALAAPKLLKALDRLLVRYESIIDSHRIARDNDTCAVVREAIKEATVPA